MAFLQDVQTGVQIQPSVNGLETFIHLSQGENGRKLYIKILGIDEIPVGSVATISGTKPDGNVYSAAGIIDDITIVFNEDIQMTVVAGIWDANVKIVNEGNVIASAKLRFVIHESAVASGAVPSDSQFDGIVAECQMYAETARSAAYGSPLTASAAADMIDTSKVYVYTGSETGYTAGHWYYYNGSAWADGGVYNSIAIQTDTTLTLPDHAADAKATGDALAAKADKIGNIALAERLYGGEYVSESEPYHFRKAPEGMGAKDETIVGGSLAWNQLCNGSSVTVQSGHKYITKISGAFSIGASTETAITGLTSGTDMVTDLTICFGSTIADYIYSLETATAGAGVAWVKRYIDLDTYHEYDAGSIQSVEGFVSHNTYDEDENLLASYPLDSSVTLRGVPKLVTDHIEFDGDRYHADGTVERRFWRVILTGTEPWALEPSISDQDNNPTSRFYIEKSDLAKPSGTTNTRNYVGHMISTVPTLKGGYVSRFSMTGIEMGVTGYQGDGGNYLYIIVNNTINTTITTVNALKSWLASHPLEVVYELATPTTETAQPFQSPMIVGATEEYISDSVVPVGHESKYYEDVAKKVNGLPKDFSTLIAPAEVTFTATRNYSVGNYLIVKNQLYKVTSAISTGGTITPNSNVTATTIMAEILALA